jgi:diguanylate cyclase (GGDEF)-like protein
MIGAYLGYTKVAEAREETLANLEMRNLLLEYSHNIKSGLLEAYKSLDLFLLEPERNDARQQVTYSIDQTILITDIMLEHPSTVNMKLTETITLLQNLLQQLELDTRELFETRLKTTKQYPSMAIGNDVLRPNRNEIISSFSLAMIELQEENIIHDDPEIYTEFVKLNTIWTQMLSNFRIYLANRMGSFEERSLPTQEEGIDILYQGLQQQLTKLRQLDNEGRLGFQVSSTISDISRLSDKWYQGFKEIQLIHHSGEWRMDSIIMADTITPLVDDILKILKIIDNQVEEQASADMYSLSSAAYRQTYILLGAAAFGLAFVALILFSTEQLVFKPLAAISRALKSEAFGKPVDLLPMVHSNETRDLVEAFSEMRKQVLNRQADLEYQTLHDSLTTLPNRVLLKIRLEQTLATARRKKLNISLFMLDLDRFKEINDSLGHHTGDHILQEVAKRLLTCLRESDTVARLGGDEFAILLPETDEVQSVIIAKKINQAMADVFVFEEIQLYIEASIGIAVFPKHCSDEATLMQRADVAMYVAKNNQLPYSIYDPDNDEYTTHRLALISDLRDALNKNTLNLHYQPKLDLKTGTVFSVEALLRWNHPKFGPIPPPQIISLAEQIGQINHLTYLVIENAVQQCSEWLKTGLEINIAVNLSAHNLKDALFTNEVKKILKKYRLPSGLLTLEITESAMMANPVHVVEIINRLNTMGIRLAIDDFGTGFSSLSYLKQFDVDELKIDKSFIQEIFSNHNDTIIVRSTIDLAHNLGLYVIAEGVETEEIQGLLTELGCDGIQGYYLSRPIEAGVLTKWLRKQEQGTPPANPQVYKESLS